MMLKPFIHNRTILKRGFVLLALFSISGCASVIGNEPGQAVSEPQGSAIEKVENKDLKDEKAAFHEAIRQQQTELGRLDAEAAQ